MESLGMVLVVRNTFFENSEDGDAKQHEEKFVLSTGEWMDDVVKI